MRYDVPSSMLVGALAVFAISGCLGVDPPEGRLVCATNAECPDDWFCRSDSRCYSTAGQDAGPDASDEDASTEDAAIGDAANDAGDDASTDAAPPADAASDGSVDAAGSDAADGGGCSDVDEPDDDALDANCDGVDGMTGTGTPHVYVTSTGAGTHDGTSPANAATLVEAFELLADSNAARSFLLLASGDYSVSDTLVAPNGIQMFGGYAATFASRAGTTDVISTVPTAIRLDGLTGGTIDSVNFATTNRSAAGESAHTVDVIDSSGVTLRRLTITAGRGGNGATGTVGANGATGAMGANGSNGVTANGGAGGGAGASRGGAGGSVSFGAPQPGVVGTNATIIGTGCGRGGARGEVTSTPVACVSGFAYPGEDGEVGQPGCSVSRGMHGEGGTGTGTLVNGVWVAPNAGNGGVGPSGGTGGGGGGGGAFRCNGDAGGGGGGAGGLGGVGGGGGGRGGAGGASIAILVQGSTLNLDRVTLVTALGGRGGAGGNGGDGGPGGPGGPRGIGATVSVSGVGNIGGRGGIGGAGATGGGGGCGGGGVGGPSIGIFAATSIVNETTTVYDISVGGNGGVACAVGGGNMGEMGVSAMRHGL